MFTYRFVVLTSACPIRSMILRTSAPFSARQVAKLARRLLKVYVPRSLSPARSLLKAVLMLLTARAGPPGCGIERRMRARVPKNLGRCVGCNQARWRMAKVAGSLASLAADRSHAASAQGVAAAS
jgi:hypothetical protein